MPKVGIFPSDCLTRSITYVTAAGSPGPLDKNNPSGLMLNISFNEVFAGKTWVSQPNRARMRKMLNLIPQSIAATLYRVFPTAGQTYFFFVVTSLTQSQPVISGT